MKKYRLTLLGIAVMLVMDQAVCASMEETFNAAAAAYQGGDYAKAGELFRQAGDLAVKQNPQQAAMIWSNAAVALMQAQDYAAAADTYKVIFDQGKIKDEDNFKYHQNLFFCYSQLDENALLAQPVEQYLKTSPKLSAGELSLLHATLGDALRDLEAYSSAEEAYSLSLQNLQGDDERKAAIITARGLCSGNLGRYDSAIADLSEALQIASASGNGQIIADTNSNLGILSWEKGDYTEAQTYLQAALEAEAQHDLKRNSGVDKNNLALVHKSMGDHKTAMSLINESLKIAREVGNKRDEAIATVNQALLYRIGGNYRLAKENYDLALALFDECGFKEGAAGAYLGKGKMAFLMNGKFDEALDYYLKALEIYEEIGLPRAIAETKIQLADLYKNKTVRHSATRDLIFEDDDEDDEFATAAASSSGDNKLGSLFHNLQKGSTQEDGSKAAPAQDNAGSQDETIALVRKYAQEALDAAEPLGLKELIWSAHQCLGYADYKEGRLEESYAHYKSAVELVTSLYVSVSAAENFGEYMAGKKDLYTEAQSVCSALYDQTQDQRYLDDLLKLGDTLNNEIQKASSALADIKFMDQGKQELFQKLSALKKEQDAAQKSLPQMAEPAADASADEKSRYELLAREQQKIQDRISKLDEDYAQIMQQWEQEYPQDKLIFESASRVDIKMVQEHITADDAVLMYTQLPDKLLITVTTADKVSCTGVNVLKQDTDKLIRDDFMVNYLECGWPRLKDEDGYDTPQYFQETVDETNRILSTLYDYLILPVADQIADFKRLYIISDGFLSQIPFGALISSVDQNGVQDFLIEHHDIAYLRPSFIDVLKKPVVSGEIKTLFAIANADNSNFPMALLEGTVSEIANVCSSLPGSPTTRDVALEVLFDTGSAEPKSDLARVKAMFGKEFENSQPEEPTEHWVRGHLLNNQYEIVYFSTHGMPYSNVQSSVMSISKALAKRSKKKNIDYLAELDKSRESGTLSEILEQSPKESYMLTYIAATNNNLKGRSPLNGFLYLSSSAGSDILTQDIPTEDDGLLTAGEIMSLPDQTFEHTRYVILSACNTAVTYVPAALKANLDVEDEEDQDPAQIQETQAELTKLGFLPGVDQVSFVDTFMRKGVQNVYGNLWFVDDEASSEIMSRFLKILSEQGDAPDAVKAYNQAQRSIVTEAKAGKGVGHYNAQEILQPFLWAPGALFGK